MKLNQSLANNKVLNNINLINLTPHPLTIILDDGQTVIFKPSGTIARVKNTETRIGTINGIAVTYAKFGNIENVPAEIDETIFIVSSLVLSANASSSTPRTDLIAQTHPQAGQ